jgi:hypothetical protein
VSLGQCEKPLLDVCDGHVLMVVLLQGTFLR